MNSAIQNAEPDTSFAFPFELSRFAAIIIVIVAAAVAAAAKYLSRSARVCSNCNGGRPWVEVFTLCRLAAVSEKILEQVGMKSANVNGFFRRAGRQAGNLVNSLALAVWI